MATKKLETEFSNLKKGFVGLQKLINNLIEKHENLEKKYKTFIKKGRKKNFKCRKCGDKFETLKNLQDHKEEDCSTDKFKCEECGKYFKDQTKLQNHSEKMHVKFKCDECDKVFRYEQNMKNIKKQNMKIFSYFVTITIMRRNVHLKMTVFMLMKIQKNVNLEVIVKLILLVCLFLILLIYYIHQEQQVLLKR